MREISVGCRNKDVLPEFADITCPEGRARDHQTQHYANVIVGPPEQYRLRRLALESISNQFWAWESKDHHLLVGLVGLALLSDIGLKDDPRQVSVVSRILFGAEARSL